MRRGSLFIVSLITVTALLVPAALFADEVTVNLESRILETFDPDSTTTEWFVRGSKFVTEGTPKMIYADAWPEGLFGRNKEGADYQVLGVNASFDRKGYNYLEFIPVRDGDDGNLKPNPIMMPGRVKTIDLWVWGSSFDYYLEVYLRDFKGVVHKLDLGGTDFIGWKNLVTSVPNYIPQAGGYVDVGGILKTLELVKIMLWTKPNENVAGFNFYMDQIKVLTDTFVSRFDGDQLADPEYVESIWAEGGGR